MQVQNRPTPQPILLESGQGAKVAIGALGFDTNALHRGTTAEGAVYTTAEPQLGPQTSDDAASHHRSFPHLS